MLARVCVARATFPAPPAPPLPLLVAGAHSPRFEPQLIGKNCENQPSAQSPSVSHNPAPFTTRTPYIPGPGRGGFPLGARHRHGPAAAGPIVPDLPDGASVVWHSCVLRAAALH